MRFTIFLALLILMRNVQAQSTFENSNFLDSVYFTDNHLEFCYLVTNTNQYFLTVKSNNTVLDFVEIRPFVWSAIKDTRIFYPDSIKNNLVKVDSKLLALAAPSDYGFAVLIPIKLMGNRPLIEKNKDKWLSDEFGFIYDAKDKIFINTIVRGEEYGKVKLSKFINGRFSLLKVTETQNEYHDHHSKAYIEEVINLINY